MSRLTYLFTYLLIRAVAVVAGEVLSMVCGSTAPTTTFETSDNLAYVRFRTNSARNDIHFRLNFSSSVEGLCEPSDAGLLCKSLVTSLCMQVSVQCHVVGSFCIAYGFTVHVLREKTCRFIRSAPPSRFNHRLRGSASPVLTATGFVNGKGQFSTPHRIDTPQPITKKFVTGDYVGDPYGCAKLGAYPSTGASGHMGEI